ncbi:MAG: hypothetical protein ACLP0J_13605 [Solirubrobacteraceae bacterium]
MDETAGMSETELRRQIVEQLASAKHTAPLSRRLVRDAAAACGVGESTMWRWIACGAPPSRAPGGVVASDRAVYLRHVARFRGECYEADHKQLSIEVLAPRAQRPRRPWVTLFEDQFSRLIVGWAISLRPTQAEVLAALRMA